MLHSKEIKEEPEVTKEDTLEEALQDALSRKRKKKLDPEDMGEVWGIINHAGEKVWFRESIKITTVVEQWLLKLEYSMKYGVSHTLDRCKKSQSFTEFE